MTFPPESLLIVACCFLMSKFSIPQIRKVGGGAIINVASVQGIRSKKLVPAYAASKDDLKPVLQGVLFKINEEGFISVATDGHRLVKFVKHSIVILGL